MVITKRLRIKNTNGEYDQLCIETPTAAVVLPDGTSLENKLADIETKLTNLSDIEEQLAAL